MDPAAALRLLGLEGSFAFIRANEPFAVDRRMHRVFVGWDSTELPCRQVLLHGARRAGIVSDTGHEWLDVASLMDRAIPEGTFVVLPAEELEHAGGLRGLAEVMDALLHPETGCPWDREQTHESLKKHLLEEAYEVLDAIDTGSLDVLREELGDLLMQPFMHAQMEKQAGRWDIEAVAHETAQKLVRRHPHVFGDVNAPTSDEVLRNWDRIKQQEKGDAPRSILAGVPRGMAALLRAHEISKRAARVGFEWPSYDDVRAKMREEEAELAEAVAAQDPKAIEHEIGDLLFTAVNLARWTKVEPEEALRKMLNRFQDRFMEMEKLAEKPLRDLSAEEWDDLWTRAKAAVG